MRPYRKPKEIKDLREQGRIILAWGEVTGHHHQIVAAADLTDPAVPPAEFFEEPDGRRVLLVRQPCLLRHEEHGAIALDPAVPQQVRQGDVLLHPIGAGAWQVIRQVEYTPAEIRTVAD